MKRKVVAVATLLAMAFPVSAVAESASPSPKVAASTVAKSPKTDKTAIKTAPASPKAKKTKKSVKKKSAKKSVKKSTKKLKNRSY